MNKRRKYPVPTDRQKIKDVLPYGYGKKIAELAGISENAVGNYWKGVGNSARVRAALKVLLAELANDNQELSQLADKITEKRKRKGGSPAQQP